MKNKDIKVYPMEIKETENSVVCALDLPLFITTSEQREIMNKAMIKAKAMEELLTKN